DITYCTNKQLAFDYLRDRILFGNDHGRLRIQLEKMHDNNSRMKRLFLRGLCFAIIDEADSVLIDEARTPLIISREGNNEAEDEIHRQAMNFAKQLKETRDFSIDQLNRIVQLTEKGSKLLSIIIKSVGGIWNGKRRREELVCQALSARNLYIRDHHYLVQDGKIMIIDANTGRTMKDRSWEHGLHQMIEIKEGCEFTAKREHVARLTYQRFFRRYLRLSGMTGTASEVRKELWSIYHLPVIKVPTNKPSQRKRINDEVYCNKSEKWAAVLGHIRRTNQQERPVLIGTRSVSDSEHLSELLNKEGLDHQVLNARQDSGEAEIVAKAGIKGCITVATNMAGRGTDIPLGKGVADIGGLHIISTEQNEARRIDRQLYGRCGRQGDHGSHISILSLEDELLQNHFKKTILRLLNFLITKNRLISQRLCLFSMRFAQSSEEHRHLQMRRTLLRADEQIAKLLAFSGKIE
ncbi:MAG: prepilin peptidase, partial [Desulfocapsa sp.]|nr:prepilin peptidase [Desulfocapsa sp.]